MTIKNKLLTNLQKTVKKLENSLKLLNERELNLRRELQSHKAAIEWYNKTHKEK